MSKYTLYCSCINCHNTTTVQSLKQHFNKCTRVPDNTCEHCGSKTDNDRFCSRSCRAAVVNTERTQQRQLNKQNQPSAFELLTERRRQEYLDGNVTSRHTLRKYIAEERGYHCEVCNTSEWMGKPLTLIVDHINGNAGDNNPSNLRLLCPNCNSQTDTFSGRNKGNGRKARGLPTH